MGPVVNFFCVIVQISSLIYTWPCAASAASTNGSTSTIILIAVPAAQPDACATTAWMAPFHLLDQPIPSSTSAHPADLNVSPSSAPFSGQERAAAMGPVVCSSKKTAAPVKYGITAAQLEYADSSGNCKNGTFPLLRALKQIVKFFKDNYTSEANFENCVALRT
ncbi:hypothetical protein MRX96_043803 [Rhipicephalus microplus]